MPSRSFTDSAVAPALPTAPPPEPPAPGVLRAGSSEPLQALTSAPNAKMPTHDARHHLRPGSLHSIHPSLRDSASHRKFERRRTLVRKIRRVKTRFAYTSTELI